MKKIVFAAIAALTLTVGALQGVANAAPDDQAQQSQQSRQPYPQSNGVDTRSTSWGVVGGDG